MNKSTLSYIFILATMMISITGPKDAQATHEVEVFYDLRGFPLVHVPSGTAPIGVTLEDALDLCEVNVVAEQYPSCRETTYGIQAVETSRQDTYEVNVETFYIDQYEVSRSAYIACVDADVCSNRPLMFQPSEPLDVPVQRTTYYEAAVYCAWREARLPTEIEWEYAARGEDGLNFPWGNEFDGSLTNHCDKNCPVLDELIASQSAWDDGYSELAPTASFEGGQSWVGAYSMSGNIQEWTSTRSSLNPSPTSDTLVVKGGSFDAYPYQTAGWFMNHWNASEGSANIGFRCARSTEP